VYLASATGMLQWDRGPTRVYEVQKQFQGLLTRRGNASVGIEKGRQGPEEDLKKPS